jgi:predicted dehydrogenase
MKIGLIGLGRWGKVYLGALLNIPRVKFIHVAGRPEQKHDAQESPSIRFTENWLEVCLNTSLSGVIVASPPHTHYEIAKLAMERKISVFVEKPFTLCPEQTHALYNLSQGNGVLCMVNYTHLFSPAYQDLKLSVSKAGGIRHIFSEGFSSGPYRKDISVLWDWGAHDLAMCIDLLNESPEFMQVSELVSGNENPLAKLLMLEMTFPSKIKSRSVFGNASEFKRRDLCVVCDDGCFVYDGLSSGLSKQFSSRVFSCDSQRFRLQQTPLERAILEFLDYLELGKRSHYTLNLATKVNHALSKLETF